MLFSLLPLALASPSLLRPRQDSSNSTLSSECGLAFLPDGSAIGRVWIRNKSVSDKGDPGQGLLDNLNGQCGQKNIKHWTGANGLGYNDYHVGFEMEAGPSRDCVGNAINQAESQSVICVLTAWYCLDNPPSEGCSTI